MVEEGRVAILHKSKKAAKFVFVDMPLGVLGYSQLRLGNRVIRDLWSSVRSVVCPQCKQGVLVRSPVDQPTTANDRNTLHPWLCTQCDFAILQVADVRELRDSVRTMRNQEAVVLLGEMEFSARQKRMRQYAFQSRLFFAISFAAFGWFLFQVAAGASLVYSANIGSLGLACGAVALKASYRAWQLDTGTLFVEGSFLRFLRYERWFR